MNGSVLAEVAAVPPQGAGGLQVDADGVPVGLFRVGDDIVAWRDVCPHAAAPVCGGRVDGTRVQTAVYRYEYGRDREVLQCPWHGWEFDLVDGTHLAGGSSAKLRRHPVRIADGRVYDASPSSRVDLPLVVAGVERETADIVLLQLAAVGDVRLPAWTPGTHLEIVLPSGLVRQYSLCGDPKDRTRYRIAVLREAGGRGGSEELHRVASPGVRLRAAAVRNRFPLTLATDHLLIAGGIGITALLPMIAALRRAGASFRVVYTGRERSSMAFVGALDALPEVRIVESRRMGRLDVAGLVGSAAPGTVIFACGPEGLLADLRKAVAEAPQALELRTEVFRAAAPTSVPAAEERPFVVDLRASGRAVTVPPGTSILAAVRAAGIAVGSSCEGGWCGTCETAVIAGVPDHRDSVLTEDERAQGDTMMICVSRSLSRSLVIDR